MLEWLSEPAVIAVAVMLAVTANQAIGALWSRKDYLTLSEAALTIAEDPNISSEEKRDLGMGIRIATSWYAAPALVIGVPIIATYVSVRAIGLAVTGQRITEASLMKLFAQSSKYTNMINKPLWKSKPLVAVWAAIWLIPVMLVLLIAMGSTKLSKDLARRAALTLFSRLAHH